MSIFDNTLSDNNNSPPDQNSPEPPNQHTYLQLDPIVIQAVWRCMLGGNDHWVAYWTGDKTNKHSGINDKQASVGRITNDGKDYRHRAGEPYNFTVEVVDAKRLGFGCWTQNGDKQNPLYMFACWDFEPLKRPTKRKPKKPKPVELTHAGNPKHPDPTVLHRHKVFHEAYACYNEIVAKYFADNRVLAYYLVESSPDHYHTGILFSRPLPKPEHDHIVKYINKCVNPFNNLDKDSRKAKKGIGTQFRAPCTWKHGVKAQLIEWSCKNVTQLVELGASLRPPGLTDHHRKTSVYDRTIKDPTNPDTLLAWAVQHYPIEPHTRHHTQASLILSLLRRGIDPEIIRQIGPLWLQHFNNQTTEPDAEHQNFRTDQAAAEDLFDSQLNRTLKDPDLQQPTKPTHDYTSIAVNYRLTSQQLGVIRQILLDHQNLQDGLKMSSPIRTGDDILQSGDHFPVSLCSSAYFIESLFVQLEINRLKGENGLRCTHAQLIEIIRLRHGLEISDRQFQRVKMKFCSMPREGRSYHHASKIELLVETLKGTKGLTSEYELAPPLATTLPRLTCGDVLN